LYNSGLRASGAGKSHRSEIAMEKVGVEVEIEDHKEAKVR
jgi:hypothetical protein